MLRELSPHFEVRKHGMDGGTFRATPLLSSAFPISLIQSQQPLHIHSRSPWLDVAFGPCIYKSPLKERYSRMFRDGTPLCESQTNELGIS